MAGGEKTIMEALTAELLGDVGLLHDKVKDLNAALPDAAQVIRDAGRDAADSIHVAVGKAVAQVNHAASTSDISRVQNHFDQIAEKMLHEIRKQEKPVASGTLVATSGFSRRRAGIMALVMLLVGMAIGWVVFGNTHDAEINKKIEAGRDFLQVLPQLDEKTRERVVRMIQKNRESAG